MTFRLIGAAALALLLASPAVAAAQDVASQMVGVWKRTGFVQKIVATGETSKPEGESPSGMLTFSRGGHFMWVFIADDRKSPASVPPTDAERIYLHKTSAFGGGIYKVNGDKVTLLYTASSNQAWTGIERAMTVQVSDKVLTWTSGTPIKTAEGKEAVATITFERLESLLDHLISGSEKRGRRAPVHFDGDQIGLDREPVACRQRQQTMAAVPATRRPSGPPRLPRSSLHPG